MTGTAHDRGRRVLQDLRPRRGPDPDQPARCARIDDNDVVYRTEHEKWKAIVRRDRERAREGPAGAGRHHLGREVRAALGHAEAARHQARGAQRQEPRARGRTSSRSAGELGAVTVATNMAGRGTDIKLGGNFEWRLDAGARGGGAGEDDLEHLDEIARCATRQGAVRGASSTRCSSSAACTCSAPSATRRAASTTSCAAAPGARATPGSSRFFLSLEDDLMRHLRPRLGHERDGASWA